MVYEFNAYDVMLLSKQALGQAQRFDVLKVEDVIALSKELLHLDKKSEYLRRTYACLRAGRRKVHFHMCQYLRSSKFSYDSKLKLVEVLAELDVSIDKWVIKVEYIDNRRMRIRQSLLEHIAAAILLPRLATYS